MRKNKEILVIQTISTKDGCKQTKSGEKERKNSDDTIILILITIINVHDSAQLG